MPRRTLLDELPSSRLGRLWSLVRQALVPRSVGRWWGRLRGGGADAGARGEALAARHLCEEAGYRVIVRNWRNPRDRRDEIDLVCLDGDILVFVEVKARSALALVPGYFAVDPRKKRVLRRACKAYLSALRPAPRTFRFDIVEVEHGMGAPIVRHFENVPLFAKHDLPQSK